MCMILLINFVYIAFILAVRGSEIMVANIIMSPTKKEPLLQNFTAR